MLCNRNLVLYHTENKNSLSLQLHHCGFQQCNPGYHYTITMLPYHVIHFVLEGSGTLISSHGTHEIHKGEAFFIPAGSTSEYTASHKDPWKYCWIGIYADINNPYLDALFHNTSIIKLAMDLDLLEKYLLNIISVTDSRVTHMQKYNETDFSGDQYVHTLIPTQALEANSRLFHFLAELINKQGQNNLQTTVPHDFAFAIKSYIDNHYFEPIKIHDIAENLHVHPNYLTQLFRDKYKETPKSYLNNLRLHNAALLLTLTDYPISNISTAVGYTNQYHFSSAFKKMFGDSPTEYRKKKTKR